jgi:uncharacterized membrane protein YhaH (DUF805 family)
LVVFGTLAFFGLYSIDPAQEMTLSAALVQLAVSIVFIWMSVCLGGKRYHDRDKSAWWMLIVLIPIIGWLWQIIELGLLKGTEGPKRFGPAPPG